MLSIEGLHPGGAERVVAALCNNLDKDRFAISVCWRRGPGAIGEELIAKGHELIGLPELLPNISVYRRFLVLKRLLKERSIDILHTHDTGSLADGAQCRLLGSKTRLVHTFHYGNYPHLKKSYIMMEVLFSRMANKLIAVGYEQEKKICESLHLPPSQIETIYNGVEKPVTDSRMHMVTPYREKTADSVVIGSVSTLTEQKGLTYLLDAMDVLHRNDVNCILLIAGDGPLRQELEDKCKRLNIYNKVFFLGWVPNAANKFLSSIDIFCQSSLWEANSIVLLEAMASGISIVTTDVGESRHIINEGNTGIIVKPRDVAGMAKALMLLVNESVQRDKMGRNAQVEFATKYTVDRMIANYSKVYESLL